MPKSFIRLRAALRNRRDLTDFQRALRDAGPSMRYELFAMAGKSQEFIRHRAHDM